MRRQRLIISPPDVADSPGCRFRLLLAFCLLSHAAAIRRYMPKRDVFTDAP